MAGQIGAATGGRSHHRIRRNPGGSGPCWARGFRSGRLAIAGYNAQTRTATTGATGTATIVYQGIPGVGMDSAQATAFFNNQTLVSNLVVVPWNDTGVNQAPTVQVESPVTVVLPQRAVLNANIQDDGLPSNTLTVAWTQLSGPGTANFDNPAQANTGVSLSAPGNYVLQLTASDGQLSASATVSVTALHNPVWTTGWLALPNVSTVSGVVPITLVPGETLVSGTLSYSPASNLADVRVLNPTTVGSGQIGVLDTTLIPNGAYWVQLVRIPTKKIAHSELKTIRSSPGDAVENIVNQMIVMGQEKRSKNAQPHFVSVFAAGAAGAEFA